MLADLGVVALRQLLDEVVDLGELARQHHLGEAGIGVGGDQVLVDRPREQARFLRHDAEGLAQLVGGKVAQVAAVDADRALARLVEAEHQLGERALARAGGAGEHREPARRERQAQVAVQPGVLARVAEREIGDADLAPALGAARGGERVGLGRGVHDVAQAPHRDRGLLELLPQAREAQHRLRHAAREHLERDQHADGEAFVAHYEQRAGAQNADRHRLLERVGGDVVGVGELPRGEAGGEVLGEHLVVSPFQARLHLQRLHGLDAGNVLGEKGLVARAEQELPVQPRAQQRRDADRQADDQREDAERDQRELPAVGEHHREKHEQEREIQDQRHRGARRELADGLDALQPRDQGAGRAALEVRQGQPQQVAQHLAAEDRVDPVPGVHHQVLAQPAHAGAEREEHREPDRDHGERAGRVVHHHLVNDHLREERRRERHQLEEERCREHVAPDAAMPEQLGPEPREAEARRRGRAVGRRRLAHRFVPYQDQLGRELRGEFGERQARRRLGTGRDVDQLARVRPEKQRRARRVGLQERDAREPGRCQSLDAGGDFAGPQAVAASRFGQLANAVRGGEALQQEARIEGDTVELTQAGCKPDEVLLCQSTLHGPPAAAPLAAPCRHDSTERGIEHPPAELRLQNYLAGLMARRAAAAMAWARVLTRSAT